MDPELRLKHVLFGRRAFVKLLKSFKQLKPRFRPNQLSKSTAEFRRYCLTDMNTFHQAG